MTRKNLKRRRVLQGAGVGIAAATAGCLPGGGGDSDGDDGGTGGQDPSELPEAHFITDYYNDQWEARWGDLEGQFEEETDIQINIDEAGMSGDQESRLIQLIQSGDPPDANTSTFDQVADLWAADTLRATTDIVDEITGVAGDLQTEPFRDSGGDIYQIPHGMYVSTFLYRTDVYEQLGLEVPETFQDVLDNAQAIEESDMDVRGYGLAGVKQGKSQDEFQTYLAQMGVSGIGLRWADAEARDELEVHFPEEEVTTLLEYFQDLEEYSPSPTRIGWEQSITDWLEGQYAQCYHLNIWPIGTAAQAAEARDSDGLRHIARNSDVAPMPQWSETDSDPWLYEPAPDGYHILNSGDNPGGAEEWFEWLYADSVDRTAGMYAQEPSRFLPTYADVLESEPFQSMDLWEAYPDMLGKLEYVQNTILEDYYGQVPESDLNSAEAVYVTRQWFFGEMINQVVTGTRDPQGAYEWGLDQLEGHLEDAREQFS